MWSAYRSGIRQCAHKDKCQHIFRIIYCNQPKTTPSHRSLQQYPNRNPARFIRTHTHRQRLVLHIKHTRRHSSEQTARAKSCMQCAYCIIYELVTKCVGGACPIKRQIGSKPNDNDNDDNNADCFTLHV